MKTGIPNKSHTWYIYYQGEYKKPELYYAEEDESGELVLYREYEDVSKEQSQWWKRSCPDRWRELSSSKNHNAEWTPIVDHAKLVEIGFDAVFEYADKIILFVANKDKTDAGCLILDKSKYAICKRE